MNTERPIAIGARIPPIRGDLEGLRLSTEAFAQANLKLGRFLASRSEELSNPPTGDTPPHRLRLGFGGSSGR